MLHDPEARMMAKQIRELVAAGNYALDAFWKYQSPEDPTLPIEHRNAVVMLLTANIHAEDLLTKLAIEGDTVPEMVLPLVAAGRDESF